MLRSLLADRFQLTFHRELGRYSPSTSQPNKEWSQSSKKARILLKLIVPSDRA